MDKIPNHGLELEDFQKEIEWLKSVGFNPIGATQIYLEKTFIFETEEEANKAYLLCERNERKIIAWWYGKEEFLQIVAEYEFEDHKYFVKVFWLTETDKIK